MINFQDLAGLLSLFLTVPLLIMGMQVVIRWYSSVWSTVKALRPMTASEWLIAGVFISFLGMVADNAYWGIAWTFSFLESDYNGWWFQNGVFANVPFRQLPGILAAYCHIRAAAAWRAENGDSQEGLRLWKIASLIMASGVFLGFVYVCVLVALK